MIRRADEGLKALSGRGSHRDFSATLNCKDVAAGVPARQSAVLLGLLRLCGPVDEAQFAHSGAAGARDGWHGTLARMEEPEAEVA